MFDLSEGRNPESGKSEKPEITSLLSNPDNSVWELIFDSLPDMVALIDLNNVIVKANKAMLQKLKIGDQSLIGHKCFNIMHEDGCLKENCPHMRMIRDRETHTIELFEPNFNSFLNITTTPVLDSAGRLLGSLHIARDITVQKESEAKLKEYNDELKELNLNKDKFFSIVAHDLRSPFQGMLGFTDLILDELENLTKAEIRDYVQKVHDSSYSTFTLLENLLSWSRLQTGKLQYKPMNYNIYEEVSAIINLLASNAHSKNIHVTNAINMDYMVYADQQMVHSILLNLTTNAIKFSFQGGRIVFDSKIVSMCETDSSNKKNCEHRYLEISVSDMGVGMDKEVVGKLFSGDSHITLAGTANEQGAGLGLILVKEMTEKQGGKLTVQSELNKGSVFTFSLPLGEYK
jgi:PAS domain S-box-containing protein